MSFFKKKNSGFAPVVTEEDVDILKKIVDRNKIKNSGASIDDVVRASQAHDLKFKPYL